MRRSSALFLIAIGVSAGGACYEAGYDSLPPGPDRTQQPVGPARDYGALVRADRPPPSVSGGTLVVSADGKKAYAADSDRDRVFIVDLANAKLLHDVALNKDDEPGRVIEDGKGRVHVALRRGGAVVTIDPVSGAVLERRAVCSMPRGIAWDSADDKLHVACAGGEFVTMPVVGNDAPRVLQFDDDLRDVVIKDGHLLVSRFRSGEMLVLDRAGKELARPHLHAVSVARRATFDPAVSWRMRPFPTRNAVAMVHQRGGSTPVSTAPGGYGQQGGCSSGVVHSTVSVITSSGEVLDGPPITGSLLPVDVAISDDESQIAVVNAGNWKSHEPRVQVFAMNVIVPPSGSPGSGDSSSPPAVPGDCLTAQPLPEIEGNAVAVAFDHDRRVIVQTREPARIEIRTATTSRTITLSNISVDDTGHDIFHLGAAVGGGVACASCHPEGGDDGRTWVFAGLGRRRTQTLRGGIMQTAPFHWAGDETSITALMNDVFARRMGGGRLSDAHIQALAGWMDAVPALPRRMPVEAASVDAVSRGRALFNGEAQCATCHNGPLLTNHQTVDVGTGAPFQVPVLTGIRFRSPFMHDGCAKTLLDRFQPGCGGGDAHGKTSQLSPTQLGDIVAFLETL